MATDKLADQVGAVLQDHDPRAPTTTADRLRDLWLQFNPQSIEVIKAEAREQQETIGIPVPVLKSIGEAVAKVARKQVDDYLPLAQLLWNEYGREGRVVAVMPLGAMELVDPERIVPQLRDMCSACVTWEDADRFGMYALEPIVRKDPGTWLPDVQPWLRDENLWVRRAGALAVGRLPMKHPDYAEQCMVLLEPMISDDEVDVRKAVSFGIRIVAMGDTGPVHEFLVRRVPSDDSTAAWVLCDVIRSMSKKHLPDFVDLLPQYEVWAADDSLSAKDRRSVASAVSTLRKAIG